MSPADLEEFLRHQPTGAICFADDHGQLVAVSARLLTMSATNAVVRIGGADVAALERNSPVCLVADIFTSYWTIRGVIAQGLVAGVSGICGQFKPAVLLRLSKARLFSFAK